MSRGRLPPGSAGVPPAFSMMPKVFAVSPKDIAVSRRSFPARRKTSPSCPNALPPANGVSRHAARLGGSPQDFAVPAIFMGGRRDLSGSRRKSSAPR